METAHLPNGTLLQGGKYKIVRFIGSGGFGCTYEGEHTMLGSKVAIKEFFVRDFCGREETTSHVTVWMPEKRGLFDKLRKKFLDEAKAIWQMQHTNIVRVTDLFEENSTAYYVMDYIDGPSLEKIVKTGGPLPEQTALKYIRQVADALAYVHSLNRLHLDLKPGNIMSDSHGKAILVDFGVSKQYDEDGGENTSTLMGKTPGYAPIEQMGNSVSTFTPATDIYALGATLYKLLTGNTPPDSTVLASGEELPPLPQNISEATDKAIQEAMRPGKKDRPQSVAAFLDILSSGKRGNSAESGHAQGATEDDGRTIIDLPKSEPTSINGHECVDLGLSVKWATCNVGAASPEEYGNYYAWGETVVKDNYNKRNCLTCGRDLDDIEGNSQYDAARANWGGTWRMPTDEEFDELIGKCKLEWTTLGDNKGYRIVGPNGNSIFLPATGWCDGHFPSDTNEWGMYWSATQYKPDLNCAWRVAFNHSKFEKDWVDRYSGRSVRPVTE